MISHKHKCIFIHIPKCAGTSFEEALGHFEGHVGRSGQDHRSVRMIQKPFPLIQGFSSSENIKDTIRRFREYTRSQANPNNALQVTAEQYKAYFKFTIVRDPVERAYSWYKNAMRDEIHQNNYGIKPNLNFDEFMRNHAGTGYLRKQTYWLKDYSGKVNMDLIVKFEELESGFDQVCQHLGIKDTKLPHKISGGEKSANKDISDSTVKFIKDFYADDYKMFGY